jgi:hypothetical protein
MVEKDNGRRGLTEAEKEDIESMWKAKWPNAFLAKDYAPESDDSDDDFDDEEDGVSSDGVEHKSEQSDSEDENWGKDEEAEEEWFTEEEIRDQIIIKTSGSVH